MVKKIRLTLILIVVLGLSSIPFYWIYVAISFSPGGNLSHGKELSQDTISKKYLSPMELEEYTSNIDALKQENELEIYAHSDSTAWEILTGYFLKERLVLISSTQNTRDEFRAMDVYYYQGEIRKIKYKKEDSDKSYELNVYENISMSELSKNQENWIETDTLIANKLMSSGTAMKDFLLNQLQEK